MKAKFFIGVCLFSMYSLASANEYICKVYCNRGETFVTVRAGSASSAASIVDKQGHEICKGESKGNASNQTMRPEQCSKK